MSSLILFVIFSFNFNLGSGVIIKKEQPTDFKQPLKIIEGDMYYSPYLSFAFSIRNLNIHTEFYYINRVGDVTFSEGSDTAFLIKPYHVAEMFSQFLASFEKSVSPTLKFYLSMGTGLVIWKWKELSYDSFYFVKSSKKGISPFVSAGMGLRLKFFNRIDVYIPFTVNKILSDGYPLKKLTFYSTSIGIKLTL